MCTIKDPMPVEWKMYCIKFLPQHSSARSLQARLQTRSANLRFVDAAILNVQSIFLGQLSQQTDVMISLSSTSTFTHRYTKPKVCPALRTRFLANHSPRWILLLSTVWTHSRVGPVCTQSANAPRWRSWKKWPKRLQAKALRYFIFFLLKKLHLRTPVDCMEDSLFFQAYLGSAPVEIQFWITCIYCIALHSI